MKKFAVGFGILFGIVAFVGVGYTGVSNGLFQRDMIIEKDPNAAKKTSVSINEVIKIKDIEITYSNDVDVDGSMIFQVKKGNSLIGMFSYKPWLENKPIYNELPNGDIVLGKNYLLRKDSSKIDSLTYDLDIGVYDYDISGDKIAFVGMKNDGSEEIKVYTKDITNGKITFVDSFKYPEFQYLKATYTAWGKDGSLYYDFALDGKPVIKIYDTKEGKSLVYKTNARNPQISPDGTHMVIYATDSLNKSGTTLSELQLVDIKNNIKKTINGSRKLFWDSNYLFVQNVDESKIEVYSLNENGKKVKDLVFKEMPLEIKMSNGNIKIKSYIFKGNNVTLHEDSLSL